MAGGSDRGAATGTPADGRRLTVRPAATRPLGDDLLVALPDPRRPVHRLSGNGVDLWRLFGAGATVTEAADIVADAAGTSVDLVTPGVTRFAQLLVDADLAAWQ